MGGGERSTGNEWYLVWVALGKVRGGASLSAGYPRLRQGSVSLGVGGVGGVGGTALASTGEE